MRKYPPLWIPASSVASRPVGTPKMIVMDGCAVRVRGAAPGGHYVSLVPEVSRLAPGRRMGLWLVSARSGVLLDESRAAGGRAELLTRLLPREEDSVTDRMVCRGEVPMSAGGRAVRSGLRGVTCDVPGAPRVGVG